MLDFDKGNLKKLIDHKGKKRACSSFQHIQTMALRALAFACGLLDDSDNSTDIGAGGVWVEV